MVTVDSALWPYFKPRDYLYTFKNSDQLIHRKIYKYTSFPSMGPLLIVCRLDPFLDTHS